MRIISNFKDYYDFPQKWGYDPHIVYERKTFVEEYYSIRTRYYHNRAVSYKEGNYPISYYIGFCNTVKEVYKDQQGNWAFDLNAWHKKWDKPKKDRHRWSYSPNWNWEEDRKKEWVKKQQPKFEKAPLFLIGGGEVVYNFCFKELGLQSFMEPLSLYQTLEQYMSNEWAINQKPIPVPSDKDMVEIKGFDKKHSFRNTK